MHAGHEDKFGMVSEICNRQKNSSLIRCYRSVLFGVILFSCSVTRASAFLFRAVNCLACVDCLRRGVGSLRFQLCSEVAVRLTTLMLFHSLYVTSSWSSGKCVRFGAGRSRVRPGLTKTL